MQMNLRKNARFDDFGRISCGDLCPVSGVLDDISMDGCKVHFDAPVTLSLENDYELRVRLSRFPTEELVLMCHPEWSRQNDTATEIGFSILRSPDTARLESYITQLRQEQQEMASDGLPQEEDQCLFV